MKSRDNTKHYNPPGRSELSYRIGKHADFLRRLLDRLSTQQTPDGKRPLSALTTHDLDDPAIAFLDAGAIVADVLAFYQERIANEGYLRTATERRSVLELARAIGYELKPGVAASAFLSFTVDDSADGPETVIIPQGTQVQSIPSQGKTPQTFETGADFTARKAWNVLRPCLSKPQRIGPKTTRLYLKGTTTNLKDGDLILLVADEKANSG